MIEVTEREIELSEVLAHLQTRGCGSVVVHLGVVKPVVEGKKTRGIRLEQEGDLEAELRKIEEGVRARFPVIDIVLVRRLGELLVGETILAVAVSAETKEAAFACCQEAVNILKHKRGLKKSELFESD